MIIQGDTLARIDRNGGAREPTKKGWDAADAVEDWADPEALRKATMGLAEPFEPPAYVSFGPYEMTAKELTVEIEKGRGESKTTETVRVSAPFEVLGECRDPRGNAWGEVLRWRDADGRQHERHVADSETHGEPAVLCASLADQGLRIDRDRQRHVARYLSNVCVKGRLTAVARTGWHDIGGRSTFVLPGETIGPRGAEWVILSAAASGSYEARGTVDQWREGVATLARGHLFLVLAISTALAGALAYLAGYEGGGIHFFGQSSIGKTTALRLGAGVWGRGDTRPALSERGARRRAA